MKDVKQSGILRNIGKYLILTLLICLIFAATGLMEKQKSGDVVYAGIIADKAMSKDFSKIWNLTDTVKEFRKYGGQEMRRSPDGKIIAIRSDFDIDTDGSGLSHGDYGHCPATSYRYKDKSSLNSDEVPYIVLPRSLAERYGLEPGDLVAVKYYDKYCPAVFGDWGPDGFIGEGSYMLALQLNINPYPNDGGVDQNVEMILFPGSGKNQDWTPEKLTPDALVPKILEQFKMAKARPQPKGRKPSPKTDNTDYVEDKFLDFGHKPVNGEYYDSNGTWLDTGTSVSKVQVECMGWKQKKAFFEKLGIKF